MQLSGRLPSQLQDSPLARLWQACPPAGDLTITNVAAAGIAVGEVRAPLCGPALGPYMAQAQGPLQARQFLAAALRRAGRPTAAQDLILVASTCEAYSMLCKVLCDPGEAVAMSQPGYPLLQHLAQLEAVAVLRFALRPQAGSHWRLDLAGAQRALGAGARAMFVISPHNPTGHVPDAIEAAALARLCRSAKVPLVVDEVFRPYAASSLGPIDAAAAATGVSVSLGGLSKWAGLPGCKLAWMRLDGQDLRARQQLREALIWAADAQLSLSQATAAALPALWQLGAQVRPRVRRRLAAAQAALQATLAQWPLAGGASLRSAGTWQAMVALPGVADAWHLAGAAAAAGILIHPGELYDLPPSMPAVLVCSLLTAPRRLAAGWRQLAEVAKDAG